MGAVVAVLRYPLKSAQGEAPASVAVEDAGVRGDRAWACVDTADGTLGSAKHPGRWGRLLEVSAAVHGDEVLVEVAGDRVVAGSADADAALSDHLGRPVRLTQALPPGARVHRLLPDDPGLLPGWMPGASPGAELLADPTGTGLRDLGPVHLVTTGALAQLAAQLGRDTVSALGFRPNLVVEAAADPLPGEQLRVGDVVLRVSLPTPRCVVPGLAPDGAGPLDRPLLGALARGWRREVADLGAGACFGVYADVVAAGEVRVGDEVR